MDLPTMDWINNAVNHAVRPCAEVRRGHDCGLGYAPELVGDCKQYTAVKLLELLLAGAKPNEFIIWAVRVPGRSASHSVLVHTPSGLVLDNLKSIVEPRAFKEQREGYRFLWPCTACDEPAEEAAARIKAARS